MSDLAGSRFPSALGGAVDVHAHVVLEETFGTAGAHGPSLADEEGVPVFRVGNYCLRGVCSFMYRIACNTTLAPCTPRQANR